MIGLAQKGAYAPGDTIRAVLHFRWEGEFEAVEVKFHRATFAGQHTGTAIVLQSRNHERVVEDGVGNLSIQQTGSESLTVEADEDVLPKVKTEVESNRLILGPKPNTTIHTTAPISYKLTV
jgi:hypothetical protein